MSKEQSIEALKSITDKDGFISQPENMSFDDFTNILNYAIVYELVKVHSIKYKIA